MSEGVDWMGGMDVLVGRALASSDVVCGERGPLVPGGGSGGDVGLGGRAWCYISGAR